MKLLYIANVRLPTDNAHGVQIMKTCEALAGAGLRVTLVRPTRRNPHAGDPFEVYKVKRNFRIVTIPSWDTLGWGRGGFWFQNVTFGLSVRAWMLFNKFDMLYGRDEMPLYLASLSGVPCVWESHSGRDNGLVRTLMRRLSRMVVITGGLKDYYSEKGFPADRIIVAHDAVALEHFAKTQTQEDSRKRLGLPLAAKVAMYIGRLGSWKGVDTFCEASKHLPGVVCVVIGGGPGEVADMEKCYPKVRFLGFRPYGELPDNQAAADILVLPNTAKDEVSVRFTSPLKLFTYMASERPIVCSDLPSLREVLGDDSAFWFKPDDPNDCARAVGEVIADSELAHAKAAKARALVENYTWRTRGERIATFVASGVSVRYHEPIS